MENQIIVASKQELEQLIDNAVDKALTRLGTLNGKGAPEILNVEEAADFLNLAMATVYDKTSKNVIPHKKKGNKLYFIRAELEKWVMSGEVKTETEYEEIARDFVMRNPLKR